MLFTIVYLRVRVWDVFFECDFGVTWKMEKRADSFTVVIERDEDGYYVGSVPALKGCHSQGETMDELLFNIREAVELCLEVEDE